MPEPESIGEFAARVHAAQAAAGGRLPLAADGFTTWDVFPFEGELRAKPVSALAADEAPRLGEDPAACWCRDPAGDSGGFRVRWRDAHWQIRQAPRSGAPVLLVLEPLAHADLAGLDPDRAAEYGRLSVALAAAVESLPSVGRCHIARWGDGGAHAHVWFLGRPARMPQLRGTFMAAWDDILPPVPASVLDVNADAVIERVVATYGGERLP